MAGHDARVVDVVGDGGGGGGGDRAVYDVGMQHKFIRCTIELG